MGFPGVVPYDRNDLRVMASGVHAVLGEDGEVLATGVNDILATNDLSIPAEIRPNRVVAAAPKCSRLGGCEMQASDQPCPKCPLAMHMISLKAAYFAYSNNDVEAYGLSTVRTAADTAKTLAQLLIQIEPLPVRGDGGSPYDAWRRATKACSRFRSNARPAILRLKHRPWK